jgi:predicted secreted protein
MSSAVAALGSKVQHNISGSYVDVAEVLTIGAPEPERDEIEVTSLATTGGYREFLQSFRNGGEMTFECNYIAGNASQAALATAFSNESTYGWKILAPSGAVIVAFDGQVKKCAVTGFEPDSQLKLSITVKVSGAVTITL